MKSIVLTGGGTIGHVAPHFAVTNYLNFDKIYYIGSSGIEKDFVTNKGIPFYEINPCKLNRSFTLKNLSIPFKFIKSVKESEKILKQLNPSVVFSKGGFVGLPVTIASKRLNIPVIVHESDLSLGLANKIASKFAKLTLTTFEKTASTVKNAKFVGAPIREELFSKTKSQALSKYNITSNKPILLITGGSSGAKYINEIVKKAIPQLTKIFFIFHIVGKGNLSNIKLNNYYETEFTDMAYAYKLADVCISRAGSNTAFELLSLNIPTLFIPLPKGASRGDQIENANYFKSLNVADVCYQEDLSEHNIYNKVLKVYQNKDFYIKNAKNHKFEVANEKIANILNKYWQL